MYRPNFCSECGAKILRLHWRVWTSRRFCDVCSRHLRRERLTAPLIAAIALLGVGLIAGRAGRPAPPPLIIERHANSSLLSDQSENRNPQSEQTREVNENTPNDSGVTGVNNSSAWADRRGRVHLRSPNKEGHALFEACSRTGALLATQRHAPNTSTRQIGG